MKCKQKGNKSKEIEQKGIKVTLFILHKYLYFLTFAEMKYIYFKYACIWKEIY